MKFMLTVVCDQYPDEIRPVQILGGPSHRNYWYMGEEDETPTPMTLSDAQAAITYFQGKAVNKLSMIWTLTLEERWRLDNE